MDIYVVKHLVCEVKSKGLELRYWRRNCQNKIPIQSELMRAELMIAQVVRALA
jgi:hypothetical protein